MGDDIQNPYQSPSLPVSEEGAAALSRFNARERRAIERFVWMNQVVAGCMITLGLAIPMAMYVGFASGAEGLTARTMIQVLVAMLAVVGVGIFQAQRKLAAITISGAIAFTMTLSLGLAVILLVIRAMGSERIFAAGALAALPCVGLVSVVTLFPPIWLAIQAWHWRLRGIDLQDLSKVRYTDVSNPSGSLFDKEGVEKRSRPNSAKDALS